MTDKLQARTPGERVAAYRKRRAEQGIVRADVYAHVDDIKAVKRYAARLMTRREKAAKTGKTYEWEMNL